jgi:hypothetical protein
MSFFALNNSLKNYSNLILILYKRRQEILNLDSAQHNSCGQVYFFKAY